MSGDTRMEDESLKLLRGLMRCDTSGGELLLLIKVIGVHVLYYEERFK
jgi:hypothetical protein